MMGGIAFCFANAPAKIAAVWFASKESALCISIMTAMTPLGCMIGFFLPSIFIDSTILEAFSPNSTETNESLLNQYKEEGRESITNLIFF